MELPPNKLNLPPTPSVAFESPATSSRLPPSPLAPVPTHIEIEPPEPPSAEDPVSITIEPESPDSASPVVKYIEPLAPRDPPSAVLMNIGPDVERVDAPEDMQRWPPVSPLLVEVDPAEKVISPPAP